MQSAIMQAISFCGALMILISYVGQQAKWMNARGALYNLLNAAGSGILFYFAIRPFQLGFAVMEGSWVAVSLWGLAASRRGASPASEAAEPRRPS